MSNQSHYEKLGVSESSSFEAIQTARARLSVEHQSDPKRLQEIELAYDALLMERLRLRQEGKIDVPDGVRFAENKATVPKPAKTAPGWSLPSFDRSSLDRFSFNGPNLSAPPDRWDWLAPTIVYLTLAALAFGFPNPQGLQFWMAIATGAALFFVYRKERAILRAISYGFGALMLGFVAGSWMLQQLLPYLGSNLLVLPQVMLAWVVFALLWLVSCFLK
jgi:Protein CHAPERONE-LIKE PROTEIN OF POR1-like